MKDLLLSSLLDGFFAAVAAAGFSFISDPPKKAVIFSALLAALGHGVRYYLLESQSFDIAAATLTAAFLIGLCGLFFAKKLRCPAEVISFPALLPMIPGMYAYRTVLSLVAFAKSHDEETLEAQLVQIFQNGVTTLSVALALAVGVTIPLLIFYEQSFTMTRRKKSDDYETPGAS